MLLNVQVCGKVFQVQPYHIVPGAAAGQYQVGGHVGCSSLISSTPPSLLAPPLLICCRGAGAGGELTSSSPVPPSCSTPAWSLPYSVSLAPVPAASWISLWLDRQNKAGVYSHVISDRIKVMDISVRGGRGRLSVSQQEPDTVTLCPGCVKV